LQSLLVIHKYMLYPMIVHANDWFTSSSMDRWARVRL
jgi:hypothetical protein